MTLVEFITLVFGGLGMIIGGFTGVFYGGWAGLLVGAVGGLLGGAFSGTVLYYIWIYVGILTERREQHRSLRPHFGKYWSNERNSDWASSVLKLQQADFSAEGSSRQRIRGKIVHVFRYGFVMDIGTGFPAMLDMLGAPEGMKDTAATGDDIWVETERFDESDHTVKVRACESAMTYPEG